MFGLFRKVTGRNAAKVFSLILAVLMISLSLGACKKGETSNTNTSSTKSSAGAAKTTAKATGTASKSSGTATSGTNSGTKSTDTQSSSNGENGDVASGDSKSSPGSASSGEEGNSGNGNAGGNIAEEKIDLGGRKLLIADWMDGRLMAEQNATWPEAEARWKAARYAEEKYNCKIEWLKINKGITEYINARLAGVYFADAMMSMRNIAFPSAVDKGVLLPLNDYIDFNNDPLWQGRGKTSEWKGKIYGLQAQVNYPYEGIWYNYDFIMREGITDPYDLYKAGNWTWDTFLDACLKATKDLNGDGVLDQWGITPKRYDFLCEDFIYSNGGTMVELEPDGVHFRLTISDPRNIRPLQFVSDLYNVYKVVNPNGWYTTFNQGTSAFYHTQLWEGGRFKDAGLKCGYVPLPKGPDATSDIVNFRADPLFIVFPDNVENPKAVVKVVSTVIAVWDDSKPYYFPDSAALDMYCNAYLHPDFLERDKEFVYAANKYYTPHDISLFGDAYKLIRNEVFSKIVNQQTTVAAALESVKGPAQEAIDNVINAAQ